MDLTSTAGVMGVGGGTFISATVLGAATVAARAAAAAAETRVFLSTGEAGAVGSLKSLRLTPIIRGKGDLEGESDFEGELMNNCRKKC